MPKIIIEQGAVYANAHDVFAREVLEITWDGNVIYNDYMFGDGAPLGRHRRCSLGAFMRWAVRPLAPEEIPALRREEGEARDRAMTHAMLFTALEAASDALILREFYRRGLDRLMTSDQPTRQTEQGEGRPETEIAPPSRARKVRRNRT